MARESKPAAQNEVWTRERCYITELLNDPATPAVSVARCRVEAGTTTERHRLSVREWYCIASGEGLMRVGEREPWPVGPCDTVEIAAGTAQQISNTGSTDLVFLCICAPRFTADCYTVVDE